MVIQCEKCHTKYNLDASLLGPDGSRVRCSLCKHTFTAYPPTEAAVGAEESFPPKEDEFEETVALDSAPSREKDPMKGEADAPDFDFDNLFSESTEPAGEKQPLPTEDSLGDLAEPNPNQTLSDTPPVEPHASSSTISETLAERLRERSQRRAESLAVESGGGRSTWVVALLVVIVLLAGGAGAVVFWAPDLLPDSLRMLKPPAKVQAVDLGVRRLSFKSVSGSFVDSQRAGHLFVIKGTVTNEYPKPRSFILVRGSILDDKGQVVKQREAYAGNTFSEEEIKTKTPVEINDALKEQAGVGKKNVAVATGSSIPFMIVFENLPDNLSEFTVEAVSSSPAS